MAEPTSEAQKRRTELQKSALFRWLSFGMLLVLIGLVYLKLASHLIVLTNNSDKDILGADQKNNIHIAVETRDDLHPDFSRSIMKGLQQVVPHRVSDAVVQPLWPWVAAWLVDKDHDFSPPSEVSMKDRELFNRGRWLNVLMTGVFMIIVSVAACRIFSFPAALNLALLGAFGAFLPRSVYFQPDPLYFMLFFATWVACVSALVHNTLWIYGMIGVLAGFAYLAKSSIQPLLLVFVAISTLRCFWEMISAKRRGYVLTSTNLWHPRNHFVGCVVLLAAHLMTIGPRLQDSAEKYGDGFHAFPTYWMWMDRFGGPDTINDPTTAYAWMDKHNSKEELAAMLPAEKPSLSKYLRTHTREEVVNRLWNGLFSEKNKETGVIGRVREFFWPEQTKISKKKENQKPWRNILEWRGLYLGWLALVLLALVIVLVSAAPKAEHAGHVVFRHGTVTILLFVVGSFVGYSILYAWYSPIARGSGDRFMLSLYLPVVFSLIWGAETIIRRIRRRQASPWIVRGYLAAQWLLTAAVTWRLVEVIRFPRFYEG